MAQITILSEFIVCVSYLFYEKEIKLIIMCLCEPWILILVHTCFVVLINTLIHHTYDISCNFEILKCIIVYKY